MYGPYLTIAEITSKYPNEWVFIDKPTTKNDSLAPTGGYVAHHSADHAEFLRRIFDFPEVVEGAIWFTGPPVLEEIEAAIPCEQPQ